LYFLLSFSLASRLAYGMAVHGMDPKYSVNDSASLSLDAKTISNFFPAAFSSPYTRASCWWCVGERHERGANEKVCVSKWW
jgi:hypothetical protein